MQENPLNNQKRIKSGNRDKKIIFGIIVACLIIFFTVHSCQEFSGRAGSGGGNGAGDGDGTAAGSGQGGGQGRDGGAGSGQGQDGGSQGKGGGGADNSKGDGSGKGNSSQPSGRSNNASGTGMDKQGNRPAGSNADSQNNRGQGNAGPVKNAGGRSGASSRNSRQQKAVQKNANVDPTIRYTRSSSKGNTAGNQTKRDSYPDSEKLLWSLCLKEVLCWCKEKSKVTFPHLGDPGTSVIKSSNSQYIVNGFYMCDNQKKYFCFTLVSGGNSVVAFININFSNTK